uniref:Four helix bundle protein n=1 Tax=Romanomermis culicivorax TaxID=13658 RepID=A0A915HZ46_ROMCU
MKTILLIVIYHPPTDFLTSLFNGWAKPLLYVARGKSDREVYANADRTLLSCFHLTPEMIRGMDEDEIKLHIGLLKMAVNSVFKQQNQRK